jgi:hypothetical protein
MKNLGDDLSKKVTWRKYRVKEKITDLYEEF